MKEKAVLLVCLFIGLPYAQGQLVISEILASNYEIEADEFGGYPDWLELYNPTERSVDLTGWTLGEKPNPQEGWKVPQGEIAPGDFFRIWCSGKDLVSETGELHTNFRLSSKGGLIHLWRPNQQRPEFVFDYRDSPQYSDISFGFSQDYTDLELVSADAPGRFFVPENDRLGKRWLEAAFDDSKWESGRAPFGFDRKRIPTHPADVTTDLSMLVGPKQAGVFFRFPFQLEAGQTALELNLEMRVKDGFAAFLNGRRIAEMHAPQRMNGVSRAASRPLKVLSYSGLDAPVSEAKRWLQAGENVLAIQGLMGGPESRDLLVAPELTGRLIRPIDRSRPVYFDYPTPGRINGKGFSEVAPMPLFSVSDAVLREGVRVELSLPKGERGTIYYTLDGSYPGDDDLVYSEPILIDGSTHFRARCFQPGRNPSLVVSKTFSHLSSALDDFSSNLPLIVVDSMEESIDTEDYVAAQFALYDRGSNGRTVLTGKPEFVGRSAVKLRGSSTLERPKKAYRVELRDTLENDLPISLLGMPADADWILYGPYNFDQSLMRNALVYRLSNEMGRYAPRTRFVEVFVNSDDQEVSLRDYVGLYLLMERIERGPDRVAIKRPGTKPESGQDLSGGYILKIDRLGPDENGLLAGHQEFVHVYPKERDITTAQVNWLEDYLNQCLDALTGPNSTDPEKGYAAFLDVESWLDQHLIQEITRNPDAYRYSTFLTKPRNGKLMAGPAWDYDRAMRTNTDEEWVGRAARPTGWIWGGSYNWGKLLMDDPAYQRRFRERGRELIQGTWRLENVFSIIDSLAEEITEAQVRNHRRWGYLDPQQWHEEIGLLKHWLTDRYRWLEERFLEPPELKAATKVLSPPCEVVLSTASPGATIYYTTNDTPPNLSRGRLSPLARPYTGPIRVLDDTLVRAAVFVDGKWSDELSVACVRRRPELVVTEIMYNPERNESLEFIELQYLGKQRLSVEDIWLTGEVDFSFSDGDIEELNPGDVVVIVSDEDEFRAAYPAGDIRVAGEFDGEFSNTAGRIEIYGEFGEEIVEYYYVDEWQPSTDGRGHSLSMKNPKPGYDYGRNPRNWVASSQEGGNPGVVE